MRSDNPLIFLVETLFDLYIIVLMLRYILQQVRADFYNPISQFIVKATSPVLMPARKIIPGIGGVDLATIVVIIAFIAIKIFIVAMISGYSPTLLAVLLTGIRDFITLALNIFIFAIIIQAILSWINPDPYNPVSGVLFSITRPVLDPFRRVIKPVGGLDLSPLIALIALMFIERLVVYLFNML
ncbi:MAG: YggT family protein [Thiotrichales bacterium]|nr:MAG: YggT family protein [Thiotrichales bacterium]